MNLKEKRIILVLAMVFLAIGSSGIVLEPDFNVEQLVDRGE